MYHGYQSVQGGGSWNTAVLVRVYNLQQRWTDVSEYHKIFRNLRDSGRQGDRTQVLSSIYHGFEIKPVQLFRILYCEKQDLKRKYSGNIYLKQQTGDQKV